MLRNFVRSWNTIGSSVNHGTYFAMPAAEQDITTCGQLHSCY